MVYYSIMLQEAQKKVPSKDGRYFRHLARDFVDVKLNNYGQPSVMELIEDQLVAFNLINRWTSGQFGHFININQGKGGFPGNFMMRIIARLLDGKNCKSDELCLVIWELAIRFGREDYALITGLQFGKVSKKLMKVNRAPEDLNSIYIYFI